MRTLRVYFVVHSYLKPLQIAVQCLHAQAELYSKYGTEFLKKTITDPTVIILNGGPSENMDEFEKLLRKDEAIYATFQEPDLANQKLAFCVLAEPRRVQSFIGTDSRVIGFHYEAWLSQLKLAM